MLEEKINFNVNGHSKSTLHYILFNDFNPNQKVNYVNEMKTQ